MARRISTGFARVPSPPARRRQRRYDSMKRLCTALIALGLLSAPIQATAQGKLVVSGWGGSWRDMVAHTIGKQFSADSGASVEYVTGGTIDRLNKEKLAKGNPESDITFTTSHVGWLY